MAAKKPQPDLRTPAVKRVAQNIAGRVNNLHHHGFFAHGFQLHLSRINPEMSAADATGGRTADADLAVDFKWIHGSLFLENSRNTLMWLPALAGTRGLKPAPTND